jgi:hypothetical protein
MSPRNTLTPAERITLKREVSAARLAAKRAADARTESLRPSGGPALLPNLAQMRELRGQLEAAELLKLARSAARLELRGERYSADDRADVAASIVAAVLADTGGAMPRRESPRIKLGRLCGDAKNLRRSIDAARERDQLEAGREAARHALTADALGHSPTPAAHAAIVARSGELAAERAATAICAELGLPADPDTAAWSVLYQWARGATGEVCAAERGATWGAWKVRQTRGAKFLREFYSAAELMARLTLGATVGEDGAIVFALEDDSREAHGRTPIMAPDWREHPDTAAPMLKRAMSPRERVHWRRRREHRADTAEQTAAALARLARAYATSSRRERAAARTSDLPRIGG